LLDPRTAVESNRSELGNLHNPNRETLLSEKLLDRDFDLLLVMAHSDNVRPYFPQYAQEIKMRMA